MKNMMTEAARMEALTYILKKLDNGVEMFALESASFAEVLFINSLEFAIFVESASIEKLSKIMRFHKKGVELRAVKYEATRSPEVLAFINKGTLSSKAKRSADWQFGEEQIAEMLEGKRTGNEAHHAADVTVIHNGKEMRIEVKNCCGRLY
jgi:hypothetical protein